MRLKTPALGLFLGLTLGSPGAAVLKGMVRDEGGSGLSGARLYLTDMVDFSAPCGFGTVLDSTESGSDGSFHFDAVPEFYTLRADKSGFQEGCDFLEIKDSGAVKELNLATASSPGVTITGVALLAGTAQRLPGLRFVLSDINLDTIAVVTDANGEFRMLGVAPKDEYYLTLRNDKNFQDWGDPLFDLAAGETRTVRMELEPQTGRIGDPGSVSGILTDRYTGIPVPGAKVILDEAKSRERNRYIDSVLTDAQGRYGFTGVPSVTEVGFGFVIRAGFPRYNLGVTDLFNLQPKESLTKNIGIEKIVNLTIIVNETGAAEHPVPNAQVTMQPSARANSFTLDKTDTAGKALFKSVAVGEAGVTVALNGFRTAYVRKNVTGFAWDESLSVALESIPMGESKSIQGTPRFSGGTGLSGIPVFFRASVSDGSPVLYGYSKADGSFSIEGIPGACMNGDLFSPNGESLAVALTGAVTEVAFTVRGYPILELNRPSKAKASIPSRTRWFRGFNLLGRRNPSAGAPGAGKDKRE